jgi:hypothetical protein
MDKKQAPITTLQTHQETSARAENIHKAESGAKINKVLCLLLLCVDILFHPEIAGKNAVSVENVVLGKTG